MSKRFTASEKWNDPWFCGLDLHHKVFWVYLLDNCDNAGIWEPNWPLVNFHIPGFVLSQEILKDRIVEIKGGKWFIPKFIEFQYGELKEDCKPHLSVLRTLVKYGLSKGYPKGIHTLKDKDKDKDKEQAKDKEQERLQEDIPEWVDKRAWNDFIEMRNKIKKPLIGRAITLCIEALDKIRKNGDDPKAVLEQSVMNSYQGVFPLREDFKKKSSGCAPIKGKYDGIGEKA